MQQEQIIQVQELSKGVESIVAVDWKHPRWVPGACSPQLSWPRGTWARTGELWDASIKCVFSFLLLGFRITSFVIPEPSLTSQTIQEGSRGQPYHPPDIKPLYCVPASMTLLFQESGHKWVFREQPFSCLLGVLADNPLSLSGALLWLAKPALPSPPPPPDPASSLLPLGRWSPDSVSERVGLSLFCLCRLFTRPCRPQAGEGKKAELEPRTAPCWAGSESGRLRFVPSTAWVTSWSLLTQERECPGGQWSPNSRHQLRQEKRPGGYRQQEVSGWEGGLALCLSTLTFSRCGGWLGGRVQGISAF